MCDGVGSGRRRGGEGRLPRGAGAGRVAVTLHSARVLRSLLLIGLWCVVCVVERDVQASNDSLGVFPAFALRIGLNKTTLSSGMADERVRKAWSPRTFDYFDQFGGHQGLNCGFVV